MNHHRVEPHAFTGLRVVHLSQPGKTVLEGLHLSYRVSWQAVILREDQYGLSFPQDTHTYLQGRVHPFVIAAVDRNATEGVKKRYANPAECPGHPPAHRGFEMQLSFHEISLQPERCQAFIHHVCDHPGMDPHRNRTGCRNRTGGIQVVGNENCWSAPGQVFLPDQFPTPQE